jgi:hypothetical protein
VSQIVSFVRAADGKDRVDSEDTRLDELTRSLQAATDSIMEGRMTSNQQQQQQSSYQQSWQEHYQSVSTEKKEVEDLQLPPRMLPNSSPVSVPSEQARSGSPVWDNPVYVRCVA